VHVDTCSEYDKNLNVRVYCLENKKRKENVNV
jgi:hypothetical protein